MDYRPDDFPYADLDRYLTEEPDVDRCFWPAPRVPRPHPAFMMRGVAYRRGIRVVRKATPLPTPGPMVTFTAEDCPF